MTLQLEGTSHLFTSLSVNFAGIVRLERFLQPRNALSPMLVTLSGIVMLVRFLQLKNARSPILVTLSGIVTLVRWGGT